MAQIKFFDILLLLININEKKTLMKKARKHVSAQGLLAIVHAQFKKIKPPRKLGHFFVVTGI